MSWLGQFAEMETFLASALQTPTRPPATTIEPMANFNFNFYAGGGGGGSGGGNYGRGGGGGYGRGGGGGRAKRGGNKAVITFSVKNGLYRDLRDSCFYPFRSSKLERRVGSGAPTTTGR
jgi:hypothetical protein